MDGAIGAARIGIAFHDDMGPALSLEVEEVTLDGVTILRKARRPGEPFAGARGIYNAAIRPGGHRLCEHLVYRGAGLAPFSYVRGYRFHVSSCHDFAIGEGDTTQIDVEAREVGDLTTPVQDRPSIRHRVTPGSPLGGR
jgi:hypothetical protein